MSHMYTFCLYTCSALLLGRTCFKNFSPFNLYLFFGCFLLLSFFNRPKSFFCKNNVNGWAYLCPIFVSGFPYCSNSHKYASAVLLSVSIKWLFFLSVFTVNHFCLLEAVFIVQSLDQRHAMFNAGLQRKSQVCT